MKTTRKSYILSNINLWFILLLVSAVFLLPSCYDNDDIGGNYYTYKGELSGKYIENRDYKYSEFFKVLDTTGVIGILNSYSLNTVFAPDNKAMLAYYHSKGRSSLNQFPFDSIVVIAKNHILLDVAYRSVNFPDDGDFPYISMNNKYYSSKVSTDSLGLPVILLNRTSKVIWEDTTQNGIVYTVDAVFQPNDSLLSEVIQNDTRFGIFSTALFLTGLDEKLNKVEDETYIPDPDFEPVDNSGWGGYSNMGRYQPLQRLYGFTALMESDSVFKANNINTIDDLIVKAKDIYNEVYPDDAGITDYKDRRNSLNRFVAYHLLDKKLSHRKFIYDLVYNGCPDFKTTNHITAFYDMYEYYETMCPNTLLECTADRVTNEWFGIFNMISDGKGIRINNNYKDMKAVNGVYHEIDGILAYSREALTEISGKRLRFDVVAFFPELVNNNLRAPKKLVQWYIPDNYFANMKSNNFKGLWYLPANDKLMDYQADELYVADENYITVDYDMTITTYPIPAGTYEVRFGYLSNGGRGVAQFYIDGVPCGLPLDMNPTADHSSIGWVAPGEDRSDLLGYENDKMMRNRGYMKRPASFKAVDPTWYSAVNSRFQRGCIRRILGTYKWDADAKHTIRIKSIDPGQLELDWFEFVPTEYIISEGID